MSFRFRRLFHWGPVQVSLNKSGIGFSIGVSGFRVGRSPDGRKYVSLGFHGTGLYWIKYFST